MNVDPSVRNAQRASAARTANSTPGAGRYFVMSVAKGFRVLGAFTRDHPRLSLAELAARSEENKATARRIALTLCDLGYLRQGGDRRFALTSKVLDLGDQFLQALSLPDIAEPFVAELARRTGESANVAIREGSEVLYVVRIAVAQRILAFNLHVGSRLPAHATSLGKAMLMSVENREGLIGVLGEPPWHRYTDTTCTNPEALLADLSQARSRGCALADGELEMGLRSLAAPIRDVSGTIVAAVNISTYSPRVPLDALLGPMSDDLVATASAISRELGYRATATAARGEVGR